MAESPCLFRFDEFYAKPHQEYNGRPSPKSERDVLPQLKRRRAGGDSSCSRPNGESAYNDLSDSSVCDTKAIMDTVQCDGHETTTTFTIDEKGGKDSALLEVTEGLEQTETAWNEDLTSCYSFNSAGSFLMTVEQVSSALVGLVKYFCALYIGLVFMVTLFNITIVFEPFSFSSIK